MVALNENFAPEKPALGSKNRVGNFFGRVGDRAGENRLSTRKGIGENGLTLTIIASGRPVWPSRDPIHELSFQYFSRYQPEGLPDNRYGFVRNDPENQWDFLGLKIVDDPGKDINDMLDDIFDGLDQEINEAFDGCQDKSGCIGSKSKCETCCGFAGIGVTLTATGKHWTARARCFASKWNALTAGGHFYYCIWQAAEKYGDALTKIKNKTESCRTSCSCRDSDCG